MFKLRKPRLMVIGHARHGKDTVCEILRDDFGLKFVSSSWFCGEIAVRPWLANIGITYPDMNACYNDRHNHRAAWHDAIADYNKDDPARLGRELFEQFDVYCGLRSKLEFDALKSEGAFDAAFWVDRSEHQPPENISSMKLTMLDADYRIDNNGDLENLRRNVHSAMKPFVT